MVEPEILRIPRESDIPPLNPYWKSKRLEEVASKIQLHAWPAQTGSFYEHLVRVVQTVQSFRSREVHEYLIKNITNNRTFNITFARELVVWVTDEAKTVPVLKAALHPEEIYEERLAAISDYEANLAEAVPFLPRWSQEVAVKTPIEIEDSRLSRGGKRVLNVSADEYRFIPERLVRSELSELKRKMEGAMCKRSIPDQTRSLFWALFNHGTHGCIQLVEPFLKMEYTPPSEMLNDPNCEAGRVYQSYLEIAGRSNFYPSFDNNRLIARSFERRVAGFKTVNGFPEPEIKGPIIEESWPLCSFLYSEEGYPEKGYGDRKEARKVWERLMDLQYGRVVISGCIIQERQDGSLVANQRLPEWILNIMGGVDEMP